MNFSKVFILIMVVALSYVGASGAALAQAPDATSKDLQQRVEQLESQVEAMRAELTRLRNELSAKNSPSIGERVINTKGKSLSGIQRVPAESANDDTMF